MQTAPIRVKRCALCLAAAIFALALGCGHIDSDATIGVYRAPPPPQVEVHDPRPGYVWINGHWSWREGQWRWLSGRYDLERPGAVWEQGAWERRSKSGWYWREGYWYAR